MHSAKHQFVQFYVAHQTFLPQDSSHTLSARFLQDADGNTLLHRAVSGPDGELPGYMAALVEAGVPVNAGNREHDAALHIAARQGHVQVRPPHSCSSLL